MSLHEEPAREIPFLIQETIISIPSSAIEAYPYSRLADLAAASLSDDPVYISTSPATFAVLREYLVTKALTIPEKSDTDEFEVSSLFSDLGIPYPGTTQSHFSAAGDREGGVRAWDKFAATVFDVEYTQEMRTELEKIERSRLLKNPHARRPQPKNSIEFTNNSLPTYGETMQQAQNRPAVEAEKDQTFTEFFHREVFAKFPEELVAAIDSYRPYRVAFALIPTQTEATRNVWDAKSEDELVGFDTMDKVIRVPLNRVQEQICQEHMKGKDKRRKDAITGKIVEALREWEPKDIDLPSSVLKVALDLRQLRVAVKVDEEVRIRGVTPMGLFETRSVNAMVVEIEVIGLR